MSVLLLTGPPAAGKNTVAEHLARQRGHCAVIDVDSLRRMIVEPKPEPWEGEEGPRQQALGVTNACALTRNFVAAGYSVVVMDAMTEVMLSQYRRELEGYSPWIVQLLPTEDEVTARLLSRPDYLSRGEVTWLYDQQVALEGYDNKLDNTHLAPEDAATWLLRNWPGETV